MTVPIEDFGFNADEIKFVNCCGWQNGKVQTIAHSTSDGICFFKEMVQELVVHLVLN